MGAGEPGLTGPAYAVEALDGVCAAVGGGAVFAAVGGAAVGAAGGGGTVCAAGSGASVCAAGGGAAIYDAEDGASVSRLQEIIAAQRELVAAATDPQQVMVLAADLARRITRAGTASLFTPDGDWMVRRAASGCAQPAPLRLPLAGSLTGLCMRNAEPMICEDAETDPRVDGDTCRRLGVRSLALAPLHSARGAEGALSVASARRGAFSAADLKLIEMLGGAIGAALDVASLFQRAQTQTDEIWAALQASNRSEQAHRTLFEENPTPMYIYDPATLEILRANKAALAFYAYTGPEFIGRSLLNLHPDGDHGAVRDRIARDPQGQRTVSVRQLRKDGTPRDVVLLGQAFDLEGRAARLTIVEDVTERLREERLLRLKQSVAASLARAENSTAAAAACLEAICKSIGWECGAFWSVSSGGEQMHCVAAWGDAAAAGLADFLAATRQITQSRSPGGLVRRVWLEGEAVWEADLTQVESFARGAEAAAAGLRTAFAYPMKSGAEVIGVLEFFGCAALPPDADLLASSRAIGREIGQYFQRAVAQERLRESEERYQDTFELAPIGVSHIDPGGRFIHVNRWMCDLLGYTREELLGMTTKDVSHPEDRELTDPLREKMHCGEIKSFQLEKRYMHKDGRPVWAALTIALKRDAAGRPLHDIAVMQDITPRKRAEEQLRATQSQLMQADKMSSVGQLAAGVAHEINNPIGYVYSNLGTLGKYLADLLGMLDAYAAAETALPAQDPALIELRRRKRDIDLDFLREDLSALVAESREGITRVTQIVQNLKDFSHAATEDDWQFADLHKGLDSTLSIAHNELKYKANVVKDYGELPEIECLPSQLNQVFMNLLVNAAHAIGDRGTITLRTFVCGASVCVEIADTGAGIAPENLKRIFDPFFTTKPVGKGTGLGLSLSYGIVQKHGGRIEVDSEPGKGTRFRVLLPRERTPETA